MGKQLSEMSIEELWHLFPIYLTEHKNYWNDWFYDEEKQLKQILPMSQIVRISHIGSTAIDNISAKPIIDILVEMANDIDFQNVKSILIANEYICMAEEKDRMSFNKGYTPEGFAQKVFHLHLRRIGDNDELYFRDFLRVNPIVAQNYEKLKLDMWKQYEFNRDAYTESKTDFIKKYTQMAKELYNGRYDCKEK